MFFRRKRIATPTFEDRLEALKKSGFTADPLAGGWVRVARGGCAIDLKEDSGKIRSAGRAGVPMGSEIGALVDGGYQKFFEAPSGKREAATAAELQALHNFEEDVKEAWAKRAITTIR